MADSISNNQGAVALDTNQLQNWLRGDTIVSGVAPSAGGASLEVDVASGTARVNGSNVAVSAQTATLSSGGSNPRKDLVYIDASGNVQVAQGTAAAARPSGSTRFDTYQPAPPDSTGVTGAVVATVWVASGKSGTFASADIRDRRLLSAVDLDAVTTDDLKYDSEHYQDVTSSRSENTWETNNSDYPLHVIASVKTSGAAADAVQVIGHENTSQTNNNVDEPLGQAADSANAVAIIVTCRFIVPPGHDYKVDFTQPVGSGHSITRWSEAKIGSPGN